MASLKRIRRLASWLAWGTALAAGPLNAAPAPPAGATLETAPPAHWPVPRKAPAGAPNVLVIMTDDVGFGSSSTFGGAIPTPTFDALAREGLRYNRFHTTAICSPTRASLLTGRNPQAVGMGYVANWSAGFDGYTSMIPRSAGTLPQVLKANGYATAMFGKGHVTPEWETGPNGPYDRWPTGLGFDYFYGFLGADTSQFEPSLVENTRVVTTPRPAGYHLDHDLADHAIAWIDEQRATSPERPFFAYFAPGTAHAPNQAPDEWLAKFRGKFDKGWDVLRAETVARQKAAGVIPADADDAPRPANLPRWDSLSPAQQQLYCRFMEAYAASLAYADAQIGRVIDELKRTGAYDNTLIVYIQGDNGASAEGSYNGKLYEQSSLSGVVEDQGWVMAHKDDIGTARAYNLNTGGWAWAMNAPFQWAKRYGSHFGGTRNGMVIEWKGHIVDPGGLRSQFLHVSDVMPTVLEIAGIKPPAVLDGVRQQPLTGISAAYTIGGKDAPSHRTSQVFAMAENLAIYRDGWVAATVPKLTPWEPKPPKPVPLAERKWQLFDVAHDFSEAHDLAAQDPKRLDAMVADFWKQAKAEKILPIFTSEGHQDGRPDPNRDRRDFSYYAPLAQVSEAAAPGTVGHSFRIEADFVLTAAPAGVLAAQGGRFGGYALFFDGGRPTFTFNLTPAHVTRLVGSEALGAGAHRVTLDFALDKEAAGSGGTVTLTVDGKATGQARVPQTFARVVSHSEGFDVGQDLVTPVDGAYMPETSHFSGQLERLTFTIRR